MLVTAPVANAAPAQVIAATGSDTTEDFMEQYLVNPDPNGPADNGVYNIQARYFGGNTEQVPGDANCATRTYYTGTAPVGPPNPTLAPNGSTAGRNALRDTLTVPGSTGCYDLARSSSTPRAVGPTGDNATFEYYAFAMDSLAWVSPSLNAPAQLTRGQIQSIYNCTFTDWSQVGGAPGPIQRYIPQPGSGTTDFWVNQYIGFDPTVFSGPNCPAVNTSLQENDATGIPVADYQKAILGYSAGKWLFQKNLSLNPTLDLTNGTQVGNQIPQATFTANTTNGSTTLSTAINFRFTNVNVGATVTGTGIPANTTIVSISGNGQSATLSNAATATGSPSVTVVSLANTPVRWITTGVGGWIPNTVNASNPRAPINEGQITLNNPNRDFFGVRYVFNVTDSTSPNYTQARDLVGFDNIPAGAKSSLCSSGALSLIISNGFAQLPTTNPQEVNPLRNQAGASCRRYTP